MSKEEKDWRNQALCLHENPELWYQWEDYVWSTREALMSAVCAIKVCNQCPVKLLCLKEGLKDDNINYGIWGGLMPVERLRLKNMTVGQIHSPHLVRRVRKKLNDMVA